MVCRPFWVDAVEKCPAVTGFAIEEAFGLAPGWRRRSGGGTSDEIAMLLTQSTRTLHRLAGRVSAAPTS